MLQTTLFSALVLLVQLRNSEADQNCAARTKSTVCPNLEDRKACLTSTESRWESRLPGGEIHGADCGWCSNGPCISNSNQTCQPKTWLEAKHISGIETCLNVADDGRRWTNLCSSCNVHSNPGEKYIGKITLIECKESCRTDEDCTAIDYGKGSRSMECYHNYGGKTSHGRHSGFDAYILEASIATTTAAPMETTDTTEEENWCKSMTEDDCCSHTVKQGCPTLCDISKGCENNIPSTCSFVAVKTCSDLVNDCDRKWSNNKACRSTPGVVRDNCRETCGNCFV